MIERELTNKKGVILSVKDKYCREDVKVVPVLEAKTVTANGTYTPASGIGFEKIVVNVPGGISAFDYQLIIGATFSIGLNDYEDAASFEITPDGVLEVISEDGEDTVVFSGVAEGFAVVKVLDSGGSVLDTLNVNVIDPDKLLTT